MNRHDESSQAPEESTSNKTPPVSEQEWEVWRYHPECTAFEVPKDLIAITLTLRMEEEYFLGDAAKVLNEHEELLDGELGDGVREKLSKKGVDCDEFIGAVGVIHDRCEIAQSYTPAELTNEKTENPKPIAQEL